MKQFPVTSANQAFCPKETHYIKLALEVGREIISYLKKNKSYENVYLIQKNK